MILIDNEIIKVEFEDMPELLGDFGGFWYILERNPEIWENITEVVIPSLIDTVIQKHPVSNGNYSRSAIRQVGFLTSLQVLCNKYPDLFGKPKAGIKIGELKYEGDK